MRLSGRHILLFVAALAALCSCLKNDMTYPRISANILEIEFEGQVSAPVINTSKRTVTVVLDEVTDITSVELKKLVITDGASRVSAITVDRFFSADDLKYGDVRFNMSSKVELVLKIYQEYRWTITTTQPIDRHIKVKGQIGKAEFNVDRHEAIVSVLEIEGETPTAEVKFEDMKLERGENTFISTTGTKVENFGEPERETIEFDTDKSPFPITLDCTDSRIFKVRDFSGKEFDWRIGVMAKKFTQEITFVNTWCYHAVVSATFSGIGEPVIMYRKATDIEWKEVPGVVTDKVFVTAELKKLSHSTEYVAKIVADGKESEEYEFTTETPWQIVNFGFNDWTKEGKTWYPYGEGYVAGDKIWDTANKGTAAIAGSITTPDYEDKVEGAASVRMESKFVAGLRFAGGNIYLGKFLGIVATQQQAGAELYWGVPFEFTSRPKALKGWYKYTPTEINYAAEPYLDKKGTMDKCQIQVFLTDWSVNDDDISDDYRLDKYGRFHFNTATGQVVDFENDEHILGRINFTSDRATSNSETNDWEEFEIEIEYNPDRIERKPTQIVITCCASYLADYFTGGEGSILLVDNFELVYD